MGHGYQEAYKAHPGDLNQPLLQIHTKAICEHLLWSDLQIYRGEATVLSGLGFGLNLCSPHYLQAWKCDKLLSSVQRGQLIL